LYLRSKKEKEKSIKLIDTAEFTKLMLPIKRRRNNRR